MKTTWTRIPAIAAVALLLVATLGGTQQAEAAGVICRVDKSASGANDGTSWADAYVSLQYALAVSACAEYWIAAGVYVPDPDPSVAFYINSGDKLYGGFDGDETLRSQRHPSPYLTILSGDISGDDADLDHNSIAESPADISTLTPNSKVIVYMEDASSTNVLDGLTITAGSGGIGDWGGAGLHCSGYAGVCSPTINNVVFSGNKTSGGGGGLFLDARGGGISSPILSKVTFTGNYAGSSGGAVSIDTFNGGTSRAKFTDVTFDSSKAVFGGAIGTHSSGHGTVIPILTNVTFTNNLAQRGAALGIDGRGGVASPFLKNVTFETNHADDDGGAILNMGGGVAEDAGVVSPALTNVTFHGNTADYGGAIYNQGGTGIISPRLTNVILWGDAAPIGDEIYNETTTVTPSIKYSVVENGDAGSNMGTAFSSGAGNTSADPKLTIFGNWGGSTKTLLPTAGSSAINQGLASACPTKDQRGIPRPQGGRCDIGATEIQYKTLKSIGSQDGWILESGEDTTVGGTKNAGSGTLRLGDDELNRQYRAVVSFNTGSMPIGSVPISVMARVRHAGVQGTDPFPDMGGLGAQCSNGGFGANPALEITDFEAGISVPGIMLGFGSLTGGWYSGMLLEEGLPCLSETGITQFRLYFYGSDDNNNSTADYLKLSSGNADSAKRPQLIIYYYVP